MNNQELQHEMVDRLFRALGERLTSVVLYGPGARGETALATGHLHLLIILRDLKTTTLSALSDPIRWWLRRGQPWPRLFTRELIEAARDVYPVELLDISSFHRVIYGAEPLGAVAIDADRLRLQCERELREKLMRLREGYIACRGSTRALRVLLEESYASFEPVWRGCLHLLGGPVPTHDGDVIVALAERLDFPPDSLAAVARLARGLRVSDAHALFTAYYDTLGKIEGRIDQLVVESGERAS